MTAPTLLASREALARGLREHAVVATGLGEWACKCSPMEWRPTSLKGDHIADALLASGVVRDVETLAGDEALVERLRGDDAWCLGDTDDGLAALAAALGGAS